MRSPEATDRSHISRMEQKLTQRASLLGAMATLAALSMPLLLAVQPLQAQSETKLFQFDDSGDGGLLNAQLTADSQGNFYSTTPSGGAYALPGGGTGQGIVFELSPQPAGGCPPGSSTAPGDSSSWCETVLYNFCSLASCADGGFPEYSYVNFDSLGNLYGTAQQGGANGYGIVFELSPEPAGGCPSGSNPGGTGWCETVLYSFCSVTGCTDGEYPSNGLVWDSSGNLYGTTQGNANTGGTVYELSPNGKGGWTEQVIYPVAMGNAGLAIDTSGNLYGVDATNDVFKLSLANGVWTATNLHTFVGGSKDGLNPEGSPAVDAEGSVYGTTENGGKKNYGTIWKLIPVTKGKNKGTYTEQILHIFDTTEYGEYPWAGVTVDSNGNIFGTTVFGGSSNAGTIFELHRVGAHYHFEDYWNFSFEDGYNPHASPILDSAGNLYGTTPVGGPFVYGTVYEITPIQ
jgi:uncharacterized repeat protein (TIGR03803 family)